MGCTFLLAATLVVATRPGAAAAQVATGVPRAPGDLARADALLKSGRVAAAEALYYHEARQRPRDPAARLALGRYLAARGATRVGAVLIEEARFFGANPAIAAIHLAPLYARLGDYKALALLPSAPLSAAERARAEWLAKNASPVVGPESLAVALRVSEADPARSLGTVMLTIDGQSIAADIDPTAVGVTLDTSHARLRSVHVFTTAATVTGPATVQAGPPATPAVVGRAHVGRLSFTNLPVSLEPMESPARGRIGLDFLARFSPTFAPADGRLLLRRSGRVGRHLRGERVTLIMESRASWLAWEGRAEPVDSELVTRRLRSSLWTLDAKRGEIVLH